APDPQKTDADLDDIEGHYTQRGGGFRVLVDDAEGGVRSAALHPLTGGACELRQVDIAAPFRGRRGGKRLLDEMIAAARARGFSTTTLEAASGLREGIALYKRYGFTPLCRDPMPARCDQAWVLEL